MSSRSTMLRAGLIAAALLAPAAAVAADSFAGKIDRSPHRGAARRRLRHLCARAGAPPRPPHSRPADDRRRRTCRARAARGRPVSSARSRPRTAPPSPPSCRARSWARCSTRRPRRCSIRPRCSISAPPTTARACACRARIPRSRPSTTRSRRRRSFGGVSTNDSTRDYGYMHKRTAGAQYDVVTGYSGTTEIALAMERGEIDGACGWDWASFKSQRPDWLRDKQGQRAAAGGARAERGAHAHGRPARVEIRQERGRSQGGRAGDQPAGVPALLYRAAGHCRRSSSASCARRSTPP